VALTVASVFFSPRAGICPAVIVIMFLLNANVALNRFGLDNVQGAATGSHH
jgi:hypothetical protein